MGRIVGSRSDGVWPRFVLVRAAEGCSWRLASGLPESLVVAVARLAGREPGLVRAGGGKAGGEAGAVDGAAGGGAGGPRGRGDPVAAAPGEAPPPERLVMIEGLFERAGLVVRSRREIVRHEGRVIGELWICD